MNIRNFIIPACMSAALPFAGNAQTYSLARCEEMAVGNNNKMKNGRLEVEAASQTRKAAFTKYFPLVHGVGTYYNANQGLAKTEVELPGILPAPVPVSLLKHGTVAGVTATQPVFAGGRILNGNKLARVGEDVSRLQLQLTEDEVVLQTHIYFWQIVNLREKLQTISTLENLLNNLHKDVQTAVKAGLTNRNDLLRVELQMQEVQSNRLKVENGLNIGKMILAQFIGAEPDGFDIENEDVPEYDSPAARYVDAVEAAHRRTEAKLLDRSVDASRLQTRISFGEQLPSVAFGGGYLYNDLVGRSNNSGLIYATVSVPISGWWAGAHDHKKNRLTERQADNERRNAIELMTVEIRRTWDELEEAYRQILLAEKSIESSTENLRIVNDQYKAGIIALTDVLEAQSLFQQSRNMHTDAYSEYRIRLIRYKQITNR